MAGAALTTKPFDTGTAARHPITGREKGSDIRDLATEHGWEWEVSADGHHFTRGTRSLFVTYAFGNPAGGTLREAPGRGLHVKAESLRPVLAGVVCRCDPTNLDDFCDPIPHPECGVSH